MASYKRSRSPVVIALALASALSFSTAAFALPNGYSEATLATAVAKPKTVIIDGRFWKCADKTCYANPSEQASQQAFGRECARVAAKFGAFESYTTGEKTFTADELTACNAKASGAPATQQASNPSSGQ